MRTALAVALAAATAALFRPSGPPVHGVALTAPSGPAAPRALAVLDDFETGSWPAPGLWYLPPDTTPMWWPSTCQAAGGSHALRAFGGPSTQGEVPCGYRPPKGTVTTVYLDLDLRAAAAASRLELLFQVFVRMPDAPEGGLFIFLLVPRPGGGVDRVPVFGATGSVGGWVYPPRQLDLMALTDVTNPATVYDLRGQVWRLEWSAVAPPVDMPADGGIYLDDLTLLWEPDPVMPTPTARATLTPRPTLTATPTATPSATVTASPTATATGVPTATPTVLSPTLAALYLPFTKNELFVTNTSTPTTPPPPLAVLLLPYAGNDPQPGEMPPFPGPTATEETTATPGAPHADDAGDGAGEDGVGRAGGGPATAPAR